MTPSEMSRLIKALAAETGFDRCGVAAAQPIGRSAYLNAWLEAGRAGSMEYLHRHLDQRIDPAVLLEGARSVIVVALLYHQHRPERPDDVDRPRGRVAMYAWGEDYHTVVKDRLFGMVDRMRQALDRPFAAKVCVDTAPLLEREVAATAGIGWIGKNTMVLDHRLGSYFFLGAVVTTLELSPDDPLPDRCGTCTACLEACPSAAFPAPYEMDASRCISFLTIEHRGDIPAALQPLTGDWIFGCDVCQEVCPFNRHAPVTGEPRFAVRPPGPAPVLEEVLGWSTEDYRRELRGSAMKRAKLHMLQRNAGIARMNQRRGSSRQ